MTTQNIQRVRTRLTAAAVSCIAALLLSVSGEAQTRSASRRITKAEVKPVPCTCEDKGKHGDVLLHFSDGNTERLKYGGLCKDVKVSPDKRKAAWIIGQHDTYRNIYALFPDKIGCYTSHKTLILKLEAKYQADFRFRKSSDALIVETMWAHGSDFYQLFDLKSGRQIGRYTSQDQVTPSWAKD